MVALPQMKRCTIHGTEANCPPWAAQCSGLLHGTDDELRAFVAANRDAVDDERARAKAQLMEHEQMTEAHAEEILNAPGSPFAK
jgi:hypothetical protein